MDASSQKYPWDVCVNEWGLRQDVVSGAAVSIGAIGLFQYTELLAYLDECGNAFVEVCTLVASRNLYADTGLVLRYYGVVETGDIDALFLKLGSIYLRKLGIIEHHGADGTLCGLDVEAGGHHLVAEVVDILHQLVVDLIALLENLEGLEGCTDDGGSHGVGEEVWT